MKEINETRKLYKPPAAKDLIALVEPIEVDGNVVSCDGGDPDLGHPRVYLNLNILGKMLVDIVGKFSSKNQLNTENGLKNEAKNLV
eukprot:CAMPEP_0201492780 /NCGR_PEP_ID=MMETSP0151_2-20130828/34752_1 /ASSEMBLY_ACC=CAM_ASM_000257 /TAXON_ID=200890 /ORGANISM="Paramoeba atlantica, Strain 621/1 / CCAP 1560/9" /LENGTH=85 /DNA_ID=CAMNT_0047879799 /DNA_START=110 /DNA_END=368 /DNA_ORIENTATION=+